MKSLNSFTIRSWPVCSLAKCALFFCLVSPAPAEDEPPLFQEIEGLTVPQVKFPEGDGVAIPGAFELQKPLEIVKRKELKAIFGKGKDMMLLRKRVDFEKQKMLLFRWNGSGKDSLTVRPAGKDQAKPKLFFDYAPGLTRDARFHAKMFLMPKDAQWEVVRAKPGLAKAVVQVGPKPLAVAGEKVGKFQIRAQAVVAGKPVAPANPFAPPGIRAGGEKVRVMPPKAPRSMRIYKQWTGFLPNGTPSVDLPGKGYVSDEETWIELWNAWRPTEKVPAVDFVNEMVLVGSLAGKTRVYIRAVKTEDGQATISVNGSGNIKGLSYSFAKVMRAGLISINGERLPGAPD